MRESMGAAARPLAASRDSLARGVPQSPPGTIYAMTVAGGITVGPHEGRTILFGRNRPEVHVCIGESDRRVSRSHGALTCRGDHWWVSTTGRLPVRLPGSRLLFTDDAPVPLAVGYTPVFVRGSGTCEHLLEVYIAGQDGRSPVTGRGDPAPAPRTWQLSPIERLVLVVLGQRYLLHEDCPQPLPWWQAAEYLADLHPDAGWSPTKVEHLVGAVRARLSKAGVPGLGSEDVGEPLGDSLSHNLMRELVESTTLMPPDLRILDDPG